MNMVECRHGRIMGISIFIFYCCIKKITDLVAYSNSFIISQFCMSQVQAQKSMFATEGLTRLKFRRQQGLWYYLKFEVLF